MKNTVRKLSFLHILLSIFIVSVAHADDVVSMSYNTAQQPGLSVCTKGYNLLAGDVSYGMQLVVGKLPFSLAYRGSVRSNKSANDQMMDSNRSISGWTHNYLNDILVTDITEGGVRYRIYDVTFPGDTKRYVFLQSSNGQFLRVGGTDPVDTYQSAIKNQRLNSMPLNPLAEFSIKADSGSYTKIRFTRGTTHYITTDSFYQYTHENVTTYSLQTASISQPDGTKVSFDYDGRGILTGVSDNRNNKLIFERNYKSGGNRNDIEQALITQVTLQSGTTGQSQVATIAYDETLPTIMG